MEFTYSSLIIPLLSFLLFLFLLMKSRKKFSKSTNNINSYSHIPGPKKLPLIGDLHLMIRAAPPHRTLRDLAAKHGPLMHLRFGQIHYLVISSLELAKEVVKTHDLNFANRPPGLTPDDGAQGSSSRLVQDPVHVPVGPVTRARAKKFKESLMGLVQEVWRQELMKKSIEVGGVLESPSLINMIQYEWARV